MINNFKEHTIYSMFCHLFMCDWQVLCEDSFSSDSDISEDEAKVDIQFSHILNLYWDIANGQGPYISRQVNIAQTLGSVTVSFTKPWNSDSVVCDGMSQYKTLSHDLWCLYWNELD